MQESVKRHAEFPAVQLVTPERGMRLVRMAATEEQSFAPEEYTRQVILARARHGRLMEFPYLIQDLPHGTPAEKWYCALTSDSSPGKCVIGFKGDWAAYEQFKALVDALDLTEYDDAKANTIRSRYTRTAVKPPIEFDATDVELGEEE